MERTLGVLDGVVLVVSADAGLMDASARQVTP
jgi:translation elongation factor EF-G